MAYALRALGKEVDGRQRRPGAAAADGVSRRAATSAIAPSGRRRVRRRDHHGVRRPGAHRRRAASSASSSSTSITIPATPATAQINWFDAARRGLRRDGLRPGARARRAADARDRDAHLPRDPHRHRIVPLLEHLAADVRHLPRSARGRRRSGAGRAQRLRQQQHGPAEAVRRGAERDADRPDRPDRDRLSRSRDGARGRRHLRGHRRADQPAADGEGDPGGRFFKQDEGDEYRVSMRSKGDIDIGAVAKEFGGGGHKNAAGCTVERRRSTRCRRLFVEKIEDASASMDGLLVVDKPAGPDLARRRRARAPRAAASGASATPARSIRWRPACCRSSSAGDAARAIPERERQGVRRGGPARLRDRHRRRAGPAVGAGRDAAAAVARGDRRGARRVPRHVPAAAAGVLGEEDRRPAQLRARARAREPARSRRRPTCAPASRHCPLPRQRHRARHRHRWRRRRHGDAAASTAPPASTSARWRTTSASGSASARTSRRCGGRAAASSTLDRGDRARRGSSATASRRRGAR